MLNFFQKILKRRNDDGASAVEYGLLVAAIAAVIVVVVFALGGMVHSAFSHTCDTIGANSSPTSPTASCA